MSIIFELFLIFLVTLLIVGIVSALPLFFVYKKIGVEKPWCAFIPFWNYVPMLNCIGLNKWLCLIPALTLVISHWAVTFGVGLFTLYILFMFYKSMGKSTLFSALGSLFFFFANVYLVFSGNFEVPEFYAGVKVNKSYNDYCGEV